MDEQNKISEEDLKLINILKLQLRVSELEFKSELLRLYVKYGLSLEDNIDQSGNITRNTK